MENKKGIAICGTLLVDKINEIDAYPSQGQLTKISSITKSVGGCVPNVSIDLKKICPSIEITAIGKIGKDSNGEFIEKTLSREGVDTKGLIVSENEKTSFTEVMSVKGGQRTFFTYAGADSTLTADDIDFSKISPRILHLGYFLLLDKIDKGEGIKILKKASECGILTSIDMVSENSDRYSLVIPCLEYTDYLIINELEGSRLTGIEPKDTNIKEIAKKLFEMGVRKKVIIHMKNCSVCYSEQGATISGSLDIPKEQIKGTTGAGDAFCAGALFAIYTGKSDREILDFASCAAAVSLRTSDATSGLCTQSETLEYCKKYRRMEICL